MPSATERRIEAIRARDPEIVAALYAPEAVFWGAASLIAAPLKGNGRSANITPPTCPNHAPRKGARAAQGDARQRR